MIKRLCSFFNNFLYVLFDMSLFTNPTFPCPCISSIFKENARLLFNLRYDTSSALPPCAVSVLLQCRVVHVTIKFLVIDSDPMSKMSGIIRRIISTTNAPAAIGPYR